MPNANLVILMGHLTRDPELKYTPSGSAVCTLGLAVNNKWTDQQGKQQEKTMFIDIKVWKKMGEACSQHLTKGSAIYVEGSLEYDTWETESGYKRSKHSVNANKVQFIPKKQQRVAGEAAKSYNKQDYDESVPF